MLGTEEGSVGGDKKRTLFGEGGGGVDGKVLEEGLQDSLKGESVSTLLLLIVVLFFIFCSLL